MEDFPNICYVVIDPYHVYIMCILSHPLCNSVIFSEMDFLFMYFGCYKIIFSSHSFLNTDEFQCFTKTSLLRVLTMHFVLLNSIVYLRQKYDS